MTTKIEDMNFAYVINEKVETIYSEIPLLHPSLIKDHVISFDSTIETVEVGYHYKDGKFFKPPAPNPFDDRPYFIETLNREENRRIEELINYKAICNHLCKLEMIDNKTTKKLRFIGKTAEKFMKDINDDKKFLKMKIEDLKDDKNWKDGGGN